MAASRVSVLLPVWQPRLQYLRAAIDSVRAQTIGDWELLVVEDPPPSAARELVVSYKDSRIRHHVRSARSSLAEALNEGIALCSAPLVARLDSDDLCRPDRLAAQVAHLDAHAGTAVVGSSLTIIDEAGAVIGHRRLPTDAAEIARTLRRYNCVAHPSVMFRREVVVREGGYAAGWSPEDYDLWCRLTNAGHKIENVGDELVSYRFHESALKFGDVRGEIRRTIATKRRHFASQFTLGDRLRLAGEVALLALPAPLVLRLFRIVTYGWSR